MQFGYKSLAALTTLILSATTSWPACAEDIKTEPVEKFNKTQTVFHNLTAERFTYSFYKGEINKKKALLLRMDTGCENNARELLKPYRREKNEQDPSEQQLYQLLKSAPDFKESDDCVDIAVYNGRLSPAFASYDNPFSVVTTERAAKCLKLLDSSEHMGWLGTGNYYAINGSSVFYLFTGGNDNNQKAVSNLFREIALKELQYNHLDHATCPGYLADAFEIESNIEKIQVQVQQAVSELNQK